MYRKLGSVCNVKGGYAFKSSQFVEKGTPLIRIGNIVNNVVEIEDVCIDSSVNYYKDFVINKGDILVALSGATTGKFGIYQHEEPALLNQRVAKIAPTEEINNRFLYHYMNKLQSIIFDKSMGAAQPNISTKGIEELDIYVPSIEKQERISKVLDIAQELIDKRKEQIEACDELIKGLFYDMFGDVESNSKGFNIVKLGDYSSHVSSGSTPKGGQSSYLKSGIPLIRSQNVIMNKILYDDVAFISKETHDNMKRSQLMKNDVLLNITGASIGRTAVYEGEDEKANVNQHVCIIRLTNGFNPNYLSRFISTREFQNRINTMNSGATREALNYSQIKEFNIPMPPLDLQNQFAEQVQKIEQQKSLMQQSLTELENNFNSLMQRAFKGELF